MPGTSASRSRPDVVEAPVRRARMRGDVVKVVERDAPQRFVAKRAGGGQIGRRHHRVAIHQHGLIDLGRTPMIAGRDHRSDRLRQERRRFGAAQFEPRREFAGIHRAAQDHAPVRCPSRIILESEVEHCDARLARLQRALDLRPGPCVVTSVVAGKRVGVLMRVEGMRVRVEQHGVDVTNRLARDSSKLLVAARLVGFRVRLDRHRLVVAHFLEVRHAPRRVGGIAMESAAELIVNAARRDSPQARERDRSELRMSRKSVREREPQRRKVIESRTRSGAEPARLRIVARHDRVQDFAAQGRFRARLDGLGRRRSRDPGRYFVRGIPEARIGRVRFGDPVQHVRHPGALRAFIRRARRQVARDQHRSAVGRGETGERPPARAECLRRLLVVIIDIGTLIGVYLDRHELAVDQVRDLRVGIRGLVHHVAPVAPYRADIEQDRSIERSRQLEARAAPGLPFHRSGRRFAQVETRRVFEHCGPQRCRAIGFRGCGSRAGCGERPARERDRDSGQGCSR